MPDAQGSFWLFQLPNIAIAAMMYTLIGRFLLSLAYDTDSDRVVWRVFKQITDPWCERRGCRDAAQCP